MVRRSTKKDLVTWKQKILEKAKKRQAARPIADTNLISIRGGVLTHGGIVLEEPLPVIVLNEVPENSWYSKPFNEDDFQSPECYAFGTPMSQCEDGDDMFKDMAPHEKSEDRQSEYCETCWANQFESKGKGKACGNRRKLLVVHANELDNLDNAQFALLKVPPTGLRVWDAYASRLDRVEGLTPEYCVTNITMQKLKPTDQSAIPFFEFVQMLPDEICKKVEKIQESTMPILLSPFPDAPIEEKKPARATKKRAAKKKAVRR